MSFGILFMNIEIFKFYLFCFFNFLQFFSGLYLQKPETKYINLKIHILLTLNLEIPKKGNLILYLF